MANRLAPGDWEKWRRGNPNIAPQVKKNPISIDALVEKPLPDGTDPRELDTYELKTLTGNEAADAERRQLVQAYNDIAKLRRTLISNQYFKQNQKTYDAAGDLKLVNDMTENAKNTFEDLKRRRLNPPKFPTIFSEKPTVPAFRKK